MKKQVLTLLAVAALVAGASAQAIPNSGFETWTSTIGEDQQPTNWISYNIFTSPAVDPTNTNPTSVTQAPSPNNYQGTYSAKITTVTLVTNPSSSTIPNTAGVMMVGVANFVSPYLHPGYACTQRPATFSYAAKYVPNGSDSMINVVALTHWNGLSRDTIAIGYDFSNVAIPSYQVRTITLTYDPAFNTVFPDTAQIIFSASGYTAPVAGSALYVDALSFSGYVGIDEAQLSNGVDVYPNPSSSTINFDVIADNAYEVVAYDMTGREVNRVQIVNKNAKLGAYNMAEGVYTYTVVSKGNEVLSRGKFTVAQ